MNIGYGTVTWLVVLPCKFFTGHVQLPSLEPADLPAAQLAVPDPVEGFYPAELVGGGSAPEPVRLCDWQPIQVPMGQLGQLRIPISRWRKGSQTSLWYRIGPDLKGGQTSASAKDGLEQDSGQGPGPQATVGDRHVESCWSWRLTDWPESLFFSGVLRWTRLDLHRHIFDQKSRDPRNLVVRFPRSEKVKITEI